MNSGTTMLAIILFSLCAVSHAAFDPSRLKLIASNENHYLFRGNMPIDGNTFQYKQLREALDQATNTTRYRIAVVSFLNFLTAKETRNRYIEENFYDNKNRVDGVLVDYRAYLVLGTVISPTSVPTWLRKIFTKYYDYLTFDRINDVLEQLRKYMNSPVPTIVYIHCSAGIDRVGYISGAFQMKFKDKSFKEVVQENLAVMKEHRGHMHFNTYNGLQWYCLSLQRSEKECLLDIDSDEQAQILEQ